MKLTEMKQNSKANVDDSLCKQMEYARLLWEQMFSVGRVIAVPQASMRPRSVSARGGSLAAHGKRVYSICGNRRANFLPHYLLPGI